MADAIVRAAGMGPPRDGEPWQGWLARRAPAYRASLRSHRDGARLVANAQQLSQQAIMRFDEELTAMVGCGFTSVLALRTIAAVAQYTNGFVLQEQTQRQEPTEDRLPALAELLDNGASAALVTAIREGGSTVGDPAFEHGLHVLIQGTAAALAAATAQPR